MDALLMSNLLQKILAKTALVLVVFHALVDRPESSMLNGRCLYIPHEDVFLSPTRSYLPMLLNEIPFQGTRFDLEMLI